MSWVKPVLIGGAAAVGIYLIGRRAMISSAQGATGRAGDWRDLFGFGREGMPKTPSYPSSSSQGTVQDISEILGAGTKLLDSIGGFFKPGIGSTQPASGPNYTNWMSQTDFQLKSSWF